MSDFMFFEILAQAPRVPPLNLGWVTSSDLSKGSINIAGEAVEMIYPEFQRWQGCINRDTVTWYTMHTD